MKLNILNGDSTFFNFRESGMTGDVIIWREMLSEGPVAQINYDDFFSMRSQWITETMGDDAEDYNSKVLSEFNRLVELTNTASLDEVILWFEFDLHCQVNLIFLLNFFSVCGHSVKLSLICPASHPNHSNFGGIGELTPEEFKELPLQKTALDKRDLQIASEAWMIYCSGEADKIKHFISQDHHHLVTLKRAFEAHLDRFPDEASGLSELEKTIAGIINSGSTKKADIYNEFWKSNRIYGMGDSQIDLYIEKLEKQQLVPPVTE
ncbi:DUF1835 domain-containing protein [Flavihumibacter sp. R14]|nr:DUF1835 domain-containing protein [Flavihumibacter soli]